MKLWEILVPASSADHPITLHHHKEWDKKVRGMAGGLTILKPAKGEWISPVGKLHRDRVIPVRIMCEENTIQEIAAMTIKHYDQEAVMYYAVSSDVQIVYRDDVKSQDPYLTFKEIAEVRTGKIISAIKMVKERTGWNLRDSKNLVDKFRGF